MRHLKGWKTLSRTEVNKKLKAKEERGEEGDSTAGL